jgi:parvulin-like peptidyl-prolyl cis-trans isomerase-like protein/SurA-like protein
MTRVMNRGTIVNMPVRFAAPCLLALVLAASTGAQGPARPAPTRAPASASPAVARVGQLSIGYDELEWGERQAHQLYRDRNRMDIAPQLVGAVRRQVLENLIRQRLLALEARRRGDTVSDAEVEAQLRLDPSVQQGGVFNEAKYLAMKAANPAGYAQAFAATKDLLVARKAGERMDRETRPDDAAIRAELERELALVSIEYLALRLASFDGSYPEPRETDVLAYYDAHRERYRRPESAILSLVLFNRPAVSDSMAASDVGYRAWEQRMRGRADSAMAAIRAGASLEDLALRNGGMKTVTMLRDRSPDLWRGGSREVAAVFAAARGTLLPEPVRSAPGWALVRVDAVRPSHIAPLREVSAEIRRDLRVAARSRTDHALMAEIFAALGDSLRGSGCRVRYALLDTATFLPGEPTLQELDRYYRAHLADYSSYQRETGTIVDVPFAQVQGDVRRRWMQERRRDMTRTAAERLRESWSRGRRDPALEKSLTVVRELEVVPAGGSADTGRVAAALTSALAASRGQPGVSVTAVAGGFLVLDFKELVPDYMPTIEQARTLLLSRLDARKEQQAEPAARRIFEADSTAYRSRAVVHFSRLLIEPPAILEVPLTREEVERYYRANLNDYSVEDLSRVRHILVATSGRGALPDAQAREKAESLLARARAGEDFARLAAEFSDDEVTRLQGGDLGVFRRGMMREAFERAAFTMRPGDIVGPVRTEVGYHILECLEYQPPIFHPLVEVYANVAHDCATKKARRMAGERADSLYRTLKSAAQAKAVAEREGFTVLPTSHEVGITARFDQDLLPYIRKVEKMKPGQLYPGTQNYEGLGHVITWVDAITPPRQLAWEEVRAGVVSRFRQERNVAALMGKRAELDSMMATGWTFDSLATLWGGLERLREAEVGSELRGLGGRDLLDSLAFGRRGLETGKASEWIEFPRGLAKLRVFERLAPDPDELARRTEQRRQLVLWRNLKAYFERLKSRYPVEILDGELRATQLLEPTES